VAQTKWIDVFWFFFPKKNFFLCAPVFRPEGPWSHLYGPVDVVGFSLGGVFARLLAYLHPDEVRQVVTVCSPFRNTVDSAFLPLRPLLPAWRTPHLPGLSVKIAGRLPVPGTFIFTRNDGIVAWESCVEPAQPEDCFEIFGMHVTIVCDPEVLAIVANRLPRDLPEKIASG
jgi:hypothetical protein